MASARVKGRSWFARMIGLNMRSRKLLRVFVALRMRIEDMVVGNVVLS